MESSGWVLADGERELGRKSSRTTTERGCHPPRRRQTGLSCASLHLPEKGQLGTGFGLNTIAGCMSNSAVWRSNLLHPKTCVAPVEKLEAADKWRVKYPSVVVTEAGDIKTSIRHRGSILWVASNR